MARKLTLVALLIGLLPLAASGLDINDSDLLLYFPVNGGGDIIDMGPGGNDGVIVDTVGIVAGKYGDALEFTEAGEVAAPYIALNERSFTVSMWVNPALISSAFCPRCRRTLRTRACTIACTQTARPAWASTPTIWRGGHPHRG